jgi:hypothetical protein
MSGEVIIDLWRRLEDAESLLQRWHYSGSSVVADLAQLEADTDAYLALCDPKPTDLAELVRSMYAHLIAEHDRWDTCPVCVDWTVKADEAIAAIEDSPS